MASNDITIDVIIIDVFATPRDCAKLTPSLYSGKGGQGKIFAEMRVAGLLWLARFGLIVVV